MNQTNKRIYKFHWGHYRIGDLYGIFVAMPEQIAEAIGQTVYFGEVLGKHSDVVVDLEPKHFTEMTTSSLMVEEFEQCDLETGYNPLQYLDEDEEYGDEEDDDWSEEQWEAILSVKSSYSFQPDELRKEHLENLRDN